MLIFNLKKGLSKFMPQKGGINHHKVCVFKHKQEGLYFRLSVKNKRGKKASSGCLAAALQLHPGQHHWIQLPSADTVQSIPVPLHRTKTPGFTSDKCESGYDPGWDVGFERTPSWCIQANHIISFLCKQSSAVMRQSHS